MKGRVLFSVVFAVLSMSACWNNSGKAGESALADSDSLSAYSSFDLMTDGDVIRSFSAPLETANLFQVMGEPFTQEYLASPIDANQPGSSFEKSLWLGILGADLGYTNVYGKTGTSMDLLASIKKLAEDLRVGQFFDFETIKRLSLNSSSLDSLLYLSIDSYDRMDKFLREDNRSHLSSLMIIGAWIEAQYFAAQVIKNNPDDLLRDRIGEQKLVLANLIKLAEPYCDTDKQFGGLCNDLREIYSKYETVSITYTRGDPVKSEKDGGLLITQTETSRVEMTDQQLEEIIQIMGIVRKKLITRN
ncbi:MAG: hypothetical protein RBT38_10060 [Bacteroidales bacterium]|jgi:hypothetical protein|nr:hypothetical protein [Bacteroidales bacterium]